MALYFCQLTEDEAKEILSFKDVALEVYILLLHLFV